MPYGLRTAAARWTWTSPSSIVTRGIGLTIPASVISHFAAVSIFIGSEKGMSHSKE